jgi:hypothetical protein
MAVTQLNTTTLTTAIGTTDNLLVVGSTANISVGNMVVLSGTAGPEACKVQEIPVSGQIRVARGWNGTRARACPAAALIYIGTPDQFRSIRDSSTAVVGDPSTLPDYVLPGQRAKDGAGNEYILLDMTFSAFNGVAVLISRDGLFSAKALASGDAGSVAIVCEEATSAQYAWCQIYGAKAYVQFTSGSSLMTSTGIIQAATTASTPAGGLLGRTTSLASSDPVVQIIGLFPTSAITTATTAATSATGFQASVWMQYPLLLRVAASS